MNSFYDIYVFFAMFIFFYIWWWYTIAVLVLNKNRSNHEKCTINSLTFIFSVLFWYCSCYRTFLIRVILYCYWINHKRSIITVLIVLWITPCHNVNALLFKKNKKNKHWSDNSKLHKLYYLQTVLLEFFFISNCNNFFSLTFFWNPFLKIS